MISVYAKLRLSGTQTRFNDYANNTAVVQTRVSAYECPSDTLAGIMEIPATGPHQNMPWMHGSYRANSGRTDTANLGGRWDTFEPESWSTGSPRQHNKTYRGPLHATGKSYNAFSPLSLTSKVNSVRCRSE